MLACQIVELTLCAVAPRPEWVAHFQGGTFTHLAIVVLIAGATTVMVRLGRQYKGTGREEMWNSILRVGWLAIWLVWEARNLMPSHLGLRTSLPLYACNIVALAIFGALWMGWRWARTLVVLVGIFLCSQALFTPPPMRGPGAFSFWIFFASHGAIFGFGVYEVLVNDFRPTWRDWRLASFITVAYTTVVFPIDTLLDANYGYMGRWQSRAWVIADALGPWPWRVIFMAAAAIAVMALPVAGIQTWRWLKAFAGVRIPAIPRSAVALAGAPRLDPIDFRIAMVFSSAADRGINRAA